MPWSLGPGPQKVGRGLEDTKLGYMRRKDLFRSLGSKIWAQQNKTEILDVKVVGSIRHATGPEWTKIYFKYGT